MAAREELRKEHSSMKWYEDPTYIKMCEEAPRMRGKWEAGDLYAYPIEDAECPDKYTDVRMVRYSGPDYVDAIPIYRQDQLQEMIQLPSEFHRICDKLYAFTDWVKKYATWETSKCSMSQLWLAFVMKENHSKTWTGDKWE